MRHILLLILVAAFLFPAFLAEAAVYSYYEAAGTDGAAFLKIAPTARLASMGGAYTGVARGLDSISANPAGLANIYMKEAQFSFVKWFLDAHFGHLSLAAPLRNMGTAALSFRYLTMKDTKRETVDNTVYERGDFRDLFYELLLSYGTNVLEDFTVGISGKLVGENIDVYSDRSFTVDMGIFYSPSGSGLSYGLCFANIGGSLKLLDISDPMPWQIRLGAAYNAKKIIFSSDIIVSQITPYELAVGAEYRLDRSFTLRSGYRIRQNMDLDGKLSFGFGYKLNKFTLDYSYTPFKYLDSPHRITLSAAF